MAQLLDTRGLKCPLPVLKARRALKTLPPGEPLEVLASDPAAPRDFTRYAAETGLALEMLEAPAGEFRMRLTKAE